jgi:hypothetical protein
MKMGIGIDWCYRMNMMMNLKVANMYVKGSQVYTKYTLKNIRYFVFLKLFILKATCYNLKFQ